MSFAVNQHPRTLTLSRSISMTIYHLMVKTHKTTGLKYLCQTSQINYIKYSGSGKYWKDHIRIHGKFIDTQLLISCESREELTKWGLYYSELWNIINEVDLNGKKVWANLTPESGTGGKTREISYNKGKMIAKDINGHTMMVDISDERVKRGELISINKGTVCVKNNAGEKFRISSDDPRFISGEFISTFKDTVIVKDKGNKCLRVDINDPLYLSGELVHVLNGKFTAKDINGNITKIDINDPKYLSGEFVGLSKNMVSVIDSLGVSSKVFTSDTRYISGELKFHGGPQKGFKHEIKTCPHCGKIGGGGAMTLYHFDNCKSRLFDPIIK